MPAEENGELRAEGENKNVTNDANLEIRKSEVVVEEAVVETQEKPVSSIDEILGHWEGRLEAGLERRKGHGEDGLGRSRRRFLHAGRCYGRCVDQYFCGKCEWKAGDRGALDRAVLGADNRRAGPPRPPLGKGGRASGQACGGRRGCVSRDKHACVEKKTRAIPRAGVVSEGAGHLELIEIVDRPHPTHTGAARVVRVAAPPAGYPGNLVL